MTNTENFDNEAFLEWLNGQDGHIRRDRLREQWPSFPLAKLAYTTQPFVEGEFAYFQHDLRRVAEGRAIVD